MRSPTLALLGALSLLLVACGSDLEPAVTPAATVARVKPAPVASTTATAQPAAPAPAPSPLRVIAKVGDATVWALEEHVFVLDGENAKALRWSGSDLEPDPIEGAKGDWYDPRPQRVAGRFPDGAFLSSALPTGRSGYGAGYQYDATKRRWRKLFKLEQAGQIIRDAVALPNGDVLFLSTHNFTAKPELTSARKQSTPKLAACSTMRFDDEAQARCPGGGRHSVEALAVLASGDLVVVSDLSVERFPPKATRGVVHVYPDAVQFPERVEVDAAGVLHAFSKKGAARLDAAGWTALEGPKSTDEAGVDALLGRAWSWAASTKTLSRRGADGGYASVSLPAGVATLKSIAITKGGDLWAIGLGPKDDKGFHPAWVLTSAAASTGGAAPPRAASPASPASEGAKPATSIAVPATAACAADKLFALLYTLPSTAPMDHDFPATRVALKGHVELSGARFVETSHGGKRYFGAFVPDLALGKKLVELVRKGVPSSTPQLLCHDPTVVRTLAIDLATGSVKK